MDFAVPVEPSPIGKHVRSEELPQLAKLLRRFEHLGVAAETYEFEIILDANVIMPELRWAAKKRRNPEARSNLQELLECATVRAYAPTFLKQEIRMNIPEIAAAEKISATLMRAHWRKLKPLIRFVDTGGLDETPGLVDGKDMPYVRLQQKLNLPIASDDPHLPRMNAQVIKVKLLAPLRTYSRHQAVAFKFSVAGLGTAMILSLLVGSLAPMLLRGAKSIPKPVVIMALVALAVALLFPESRKKLFGIVEQMLDGATHAIGGCFSVLQPLLAEHERNQQQATAALKEAQAALHSVAPVPAKRPRRRKTREMIVLSATR